MLKHEQRMLALAGIVESAVIAVIHCCGVVLIFHPQLIQFPQVPLVALVVAEYQSFHSAIFLNLSYLLLLK